MTAARWFGVDDRGHWSRAVIDSFAIAAGVAAVVLALALSHGAAVRAAKPMYGLDRQLVVVAGTAPSSSGVQTGFVSTSLTSDDVLALGNAGYVPDGLGVAPTTGLRTDVHSLDRVWHTDVVGSSDAFAAVRGYQMASGRFLTASDIQTRAPDVVLGQTVVNSLFSGQNPVGRDVTIGNQSFHVVGTFRARGFSGPYDQDDLVVTPITTAWTALLTTQKTPIDQVLIRAASPKGAAATAREATSTLLKRHTVVNPAQADFTVQIQQRLAAPGLRTAAGLKRALELTGLALLLAGAIHLALVARVRRSFGHVARSETDGLTTLAATLLLGLIGAVIGVVFAIVAAPAMHRLGSDLPNAGVTLYGAAAGIALGVIAAGLSLLPALFARTGAPPDPADEPEADSGPVGQDERVGGRAGG